MDITDSLLTLIATALSVGFLGSTHCLAMCGGIASAMNYNAVNTPSCQPSSTLSPISKHLLFSIGRLSSYMLAGAIAGTFGQGMFSLTESWALPIARALTGVMMILIGLYLTQWWPILIHFERWGARIWSKINQRLTPMLPANRWDKALAVGFCWGWLPCGLVYSALIIAMATQSALKGALIMLFFGLGTLPAVIGVGLTTRRVTLNRSKRIAGIVLMLFGLSSLLFQIYHTLGHAGHTGHRMHSEHAEHTEDHTDHTHHHNSHSTVKSYSE